MGIRKKGGVKEKVIKKRVIKEGGSKNKCLSGSVEVKAEVE